MRPAKKLHTHRAVLADLWSPVFVPVPLLTLVQVLPQPLNIQVALSLPVAAVEGAPAQEQEVLLAGLATAHIKSREWWLLQ